MASTGASIRSCEMVGTQCDRPIEKTAIFDNVFGEEVRLGLCAEHAVEFAKPEVRRRMVAEAEATWNMMEPFISKEGLLRHPAQLALVAHQDQCQQCAAVRDWIVEQQQAGRIKSAEDVTRIGLYVVANSCPAGAKLNEAVGRAMQGA